MKRNLEYIFFLFLFSVPLVSQHHENNWVHRNATDTTIVRCWNDSLTRISYPPNSMGMGMMDPDSIYCRITRMPMDSLRHPFDSTFIGWHRMEIGSDSSHFNFMHCDPGYGSNYMMQFMKNLRCELYWDSLKTDSLHRHWHPTGVMGWNGSKWTALSNVNISGNKAVVITSISYSALAIVGKTNQITGSNESKSVPNVFVIRQNYPNPFNPTTTISYTLPEVNLVTLTVYDNLGRELTQLVNGFKPEGKYEVVFDATKYASGIYYYKIVAGKNSATGKMLLLK